MFKMSLLHSLWCGCDVMDWWVMKGSWQPGGWPNWGREEAVEWYVVIIWLRQMQCGRCYEWVLNASNIQYLHLQKPSCQVDRPPAKTRRKDGINHCHALELACFECTFTVKRKKIFFGIPERERENCSIYITVEFKSARTQYIWPSGCKVEVSLSIGSETHISDTHWFLNARVGGFRELGSTRCRTAAYPELWRRGRREREWHLKQHKPHTSDALMKMFSKLQRGEEEKWMEDQKHQNWTINSDKISKLGTKSPRKPAKQYPLSGDGDNSHGERDYLVFNF